MEERGEAHDQSRVGEKQQPAKYIINSHKIFSKHQQYSQEEEEARTRNLYSSCTRMRKSMSQKKAPSHLQLISRISLSVRGIRRDGQSFAGGLGFRQMIKPTLGPANLLE